MSSYTFRQALPNDYAQVVELMNSGYRGESSRAGWTTEANYFGGERINADALSRQLSEGPGRSMLLMESAGELVACVFLERHCGADRLGCYLGMLTVRPQLQAAGLGRILLTAAEADARAAGCTRMTLGVLNPRTELMSWYERRGYRRTGETKPFPYETQREREKPLREDLHFIFFEKQL